MVALARRRAGITRVARVTGLDWAGVEVACAVRPTGHILQVSQGKGATYEEAARSATFEAFELWASEHPDPSTFTWASAAELRQHATVWSPVELQALANSALWSEALVLPWVEARRLSRRGSVWVPAQLAYCPSPSVADVGVLASVWTSNGLGAHLRRDGALRHAICELAEREALSRVLPSGWTAPALRRRRVSPTSTASAIASNGFEVACFDVTPAGPWGWPVAAVLLRDTRRGHHALTSGYACRSSLDAGVDAALFEAAQSRLTDIHGARDDIRHQRSEEAAHADALFELPVRERPAARRQAAVPLEAMELAVVDLPSPGQGVRVVKVLSPGARVAGVLAQ